MIDSFTDFMFLIDIFLSFFTSYYDEDYNLIDDRRVITRKYLRGWFIIDFFSIIPFNIILEQSNYHKLVRLARIGKMYKLIKMSRMVRMLKIVKERNKLVKYLNEVLKIGIGFERLLFLMLIFLVLCHIAACLW